MDVESLVNFWQLWNEWNIVYAAWVICDSQIQGQWILLNVRYSFALIIYADYWFRFGLMISQTHHPRVIPFFFKY